MSVEELLEMFLKLNKDLVISKITDTNEFTVCYRNCDIKKGVALVSEYGRGITLKEALLDYANKISGQTLVFDAYSNNRTEVRVLVVKKTED